MSNRSFSDSSRSPIIGINCSLIRAFAGAPACFSVLQGYPQCVTQMGGIPVVVPPSDSQETLTEVLDVCDAFIFTGGPDLDPRNDGFALHRSVRLMDKFRERSDRFLMEQIAARRMPVLAIGVGMQLLNVSQGGTLSLHIPDDFPQALPHRAKGGDAQVIRHGVVLEPVDSLLYNVYGGAGTEKRENFHSVTSMHHMAVDDVAPDFMVTARSAGDNIIEAIESRDEDWFAVGVQFHPEHPAATEIDRLVFREFIDGVRDFYATGKNPFASGLKRCERV